MAWLLVQKLLIAIVYENSRIVIVYSLFNRLAPHTVRPRVESRVAPACFLNFPRIAFPPVSLNPAKSL
jgi:hypothetical protein